jgi:hypothetical protein
MAMDTCAACGQVIAFGAKEVGGRKTCNEKCAAAFVVAIAAQQIPESVVLERAHAIRTGPCPKCGSVGQSIDIQIAHRCISLLVMTRRSTHTLLGCQSCGNKLRLRESFISAVCGWWGFPWGLLFTPLQIGRNISAMFPKPSTGPSPELLGTTRHMLVREQGLIS